MGHHLMTLFGVDVSHHQGQINWSAAAGAGLTFAFCKASEGTSFTDPSLRINLAGIRGAGLVPGAYHFLTGGRPGAEQAAAYLAALEDAGAPAELLCGLDVEFAKVRPTRQHVIDFAAAFARARPNAVLIVYTGATFWRVLTGGLDGPAHHLALWDAGTGHSPDAYVPGTGSIRHLWAEVSTRGWPGYGGWGPEDRAFLQFSARAQVPGIRGDVDADAFFGDLEHLVAFTGKDTTTVALDDKDIARIWASPAADVIAHNTVVDPDKPTDPANPNWRPASVLEETNRLIRSIHAKLEQLAVAGIDVDDVAAKVGAVVLAGHLDEAIATRVDALIAARYAG